MTTDGIDGGPEEDDGPDDAGYTEYMEAWARRMETTVRPEGLKVHTLYGAEGPSHDPYSFVEYRVTTPDGRRILYHAGLGEYLEMGGVALAIGPDRDLRQIFEALVGFDCDQLEWWADAPYRGAPCMACGREGCRGTCCE